MPSITINWPAFGQDPYGEKLVAGLNAIISAINGGLSSETPLPLGPVGNAGTTSGPGAAADHVHPVDGLATTADLNAAVIGSGGTPPARQILAGDGLTGGGDLTEDRTISVVFGSTAGTVVEGDDPRLEGGTLTDQEFGSPDTLAYALSVEGDLTPRFAIYADGTLAMGSEPVTIASVTGTSTVTVTTSTDHSLGTADKVTIAGVTGITGVNGVHTITRTSETAFTLNGATGVGTYTGGGAVQRILGGTGAATEGTWNLVMPDTTRDGLVVRGIAGGTGQLATFRDYQGAPAFNVGAIGGAGVISADPHDLLYVTDDPFDRTFAANSAGGLRMASGDPAGGVEVLAIGNATTEPTGVPDGSHLGEAAFTTTEGAIVWARAGRLQARTSAGHEDDLLHPVQRRTASISAAGGDTALVVEGTLPPTVASTAVTITADDQAAGPLVRYTADATAGVDAGLISAPGVLQARWAPYFYARIRTDPSAISQTRLWVGLTDSELASLAAAPTTQHVAGFRYDVGLDGTAFWRAVTCDGTSATTTTTTQAIAVDTGYELAIEINSAGTSIRFWVNSALAATHTTHLPGSTAALAYIARLRTLTTASRALRVGRIAWSAK